MIVLKDIPGITTKELINTISSYGAADEEITTGHGGVVVSERLAYRFLRDYLGVVDDMTSETDEIQQATLMETPVRRIPAGRRKRGT